MREKRSLRLTGYEQLFSYFYDSCCVIFHVAAVVCEAMACIDFYERGHRHLFYGSVAWFVLAGLSYAVFFALHITNCERVVSVIKWTLMIFPIAPLVPLMIFFGTKFDLIPKGKLFTLLSGKDLNSPNDGWWRQFLLTKVVANSGFLLGIVIDTIPQHMVQVVSIALTETAPTIIIVSLAVSIGTVGTHSLLLSFSIHRPTFAFNYMCFVIDVLKLYWTLSWLFFQSDNFWSESVYLFIGGRPLTIAWWYQRSFLALFTFFGGVLIVIAALQYYWHSYRNGASWEDTATRMLSVVWMSLLGVLGFIPLMLVLQFATFSALPIFVEQSWRFPYLHARNEMFPKLFRWLDQGRDLEGKIWQVNRYYATKYLERSLEKTSRRYVAALHTVRQAEINGFTPKVIRLEK